LMIWLQKKNQKNLNLEGVFNFIFYVSYVFSLDYYIMDCDNKVSIKVHK